jgi:4'-phosphopantetheinyl transferase EntD
MLDFIASPSERARLRGLAARAPGPSWDRLLFSAKESVYKTWFPLTRRWLGFESADVVIDASSGTFTARLLVPGPVVNGEPLSLLHGQLLIAGGLLLTAIVVPAGSTPGRGGILACDIASARRNAADPGHG